MFFLPVVLLLTRTVNAFQPCSIFGPGFPAPHNLSVSPIFKSASDNFTSLIKSVISSRKSRYGQFDSNTTTFSLQVFSTSTDTPLYEFHHTAPGLEYSGTGVREVDSDSIYRIGSVTKLLTVYSFLNAAGDANFHYPVTRWVPELRAAASSNNSTKYPVEYVAWDDVTLGQLAAQMAGIGRDGSLQGEITQETLNWTGYGFPLLESSSIPTCAAVTLCNRTEFFAIFTGRPPVYLPSTTPVYSNVAFQILAYALEEIVGQAFPEIIEQTMRKDLGLMRTALSIPTNDTFTANGVIPLGLANSRWAFDGGDENPAILRSTLLPPELTLRWMKPVGARTADPNLLAGAGFEILTFTDPSTKQITDLYTKSDNLGIYSSLLILSPDYDFGFTIMAAGLNNLDTAQAVGQLLVDQFVPAVVNAARAEADSNYAGTYISSNRALNSSIRLSTIPSQLGLSISSWISNGTDMLAVSAELVLRSPGSPVNVTLYPSNLKSQASDGGYKREFRAIFEDPTVENPGGLFTNKCQSWVFMEEIVYGRLALDEFVFTVEKGGSAKSLVSSALREVLSRQ
ncbi:uncharacterized protein A1O9_12741 [Exophiala aquamarina CBS 119918]|uniref:Uncharacterized protein n=1 Tax=Exophiala aquamarina CBS 119918 TaxID=1182545 RepID=A0A072NW40_9EURO|nr:uncharacterized protein A1O9_12741 [Exophiala aquamarina CBS 119918]KEF51238.1 hypothetical protein A1O9_12741 [Exophiala aquamarina CBS 119918]